MGLHRESGCNPFPLTVHRFWGDLGIPLYGNTKFPGTKSAKDVQGKIIPNLTLQTLRTTEYRCHRQSGDWANTGVTPERGVTPGRLKGQVLKVAGPKKKRPLGSLVPSENPGIILKFFFIQAPREEAIFRDSFSRGPPWRPLDSRGWAHQRGRETHLFFPFPGFSGEWPARVLDTGAPGRKKGGDNSPGGGHKLWGPPSGAHGGENWATAQGFVKNTPGGATKEERHCAPPPGQKGAGENNT